ncbi:MAG: glucose 1-dehydrogenase [Dehalococcoidales bacterium]|nr:glucose 1-dehydrogenase [Dehalococcoidales bacterium]
MSMPEFSLEGKVAIVTGASRGIGEATALGFARAGANVVVASRKLSDLERVAEDIQKMGRQALPVATHIGRLDQIQNLVEQTVNKFGKIDILVNNAGTSVIWTPVENMEERAWDVIMNLNLKGLFFLSQAVARVMREKGAGGSIINVSSVDGLKPETNNSAYNISKAGVIMATKVMAREWAQYKIRANCIAPGFISTKLMNSRWDVDPDNKPHVLNRILLHGVGEPDFITGAMVFLASNASSYLTGETVTVDGGYMLT